MHYIFEVADLWMLALVSLWVSGVFVLTSIYIFEKRQSVPGATTDPTFFDRVTEYHCEI